MSTADVRRWSNACPWDGIGSGGKLGALLSRRVAGPPGTGARSIAEIVGVDARNSTACKKANTQGLVEESLR
jgi:hypothetical protein